MSSFFDKLKKLLFGSDKESDQKTSQASPQDTEKKRATPVQKARASLDKTKPQGSSQLSQSQTPNRKSPEKPGAKKQVDSQLSETGKGKAVASVAFSKAMDRGTPRKREPFFVQIGLDFGTAFCKCVCRDMFLDKAWIHCVPGRENEEMPFLSPSAIRFNGRSLQKVRNLQGAYEENGLYHIKMALQQVGLADWTASVLQPFKEAAQKASENDLVKFVEVCTIYLLSGVLGGIKSEIHLRYPGKVEGDYLAVNMAVPVADANHPKVCRLFDKALRLAWLLADDLAGHPDVSYVDMLSLLAKKSKQAEGDDIREACYIYPEVSANVQGFVRSRTSQQGLYLFSDTGAGTVDQSVFLFARKDGQDHLTYLHAGVFPLGSSNLERLAAINDGDMSLKNLERWRLKKEAGENSQPLLTAKKTISVKLEKGTNQSIALAKKKLFSKRQINDLRILFGGGGHSETPYRTSVMSTFEGVLFHPEEIKGRQRKGESFDLGMPIPNDLPLQEHQRRWMSRLNVAYGLSFERGQLATFRLPKDVDTPSPQQVWAPSRPKAYAPTKDDV
ncbi:MAG: hypothetical protein AB7F21_07015 [Desulfuromonadales bacterium]